MVYSRMAFCKKFILLLILVVACYADSQRVNGGTEMAKGGLRTNDRQYQRSSTARNPHLKTQTHLNSNGPLLVDSSVSNLNQRHSSTEEDNLDLGALKQLYSDVVSLNTTTKVCEPLKVGQNDGFHMLCHHFPMESFPCHFISFGIEFDYTFDKSLHELKNCSGIALDPTVSHPIKMTPGVIFIKAGANSPRANPQWTSWSVPELKKWYGHPLYALKMDCEGCEYSLAQDILRDDPLFFHSVLQFNMEIHLPRTFANERDILNLGRLIRIIYQSGMKLVHVDSERCGPKDRDKGCDPKLESIGFPCDPGCRSYLFSHKTTTYADWMATIAERKKSSSV